MTTDNRRKEDASKAQMGESRESLVPLPNSAMVDKAERETSTLPSGYDTYIVTIESVLDECNIQEAIKAVIGNKGAPGIDGITTEEIKTVMQKQWPQIKQDILGLNFNYNINRPFSIPAFYYDLAEVRAELLSSYVKLHCFFFAGLKAEA